MPSYLMPPASSHLTDDVDASFFDQLGSELDTEKQSSNATSLAHQQPGSELTVTDALAGLNINDSVLQEENVETRTVMVAQKQVQEVAKVETKVTEASWNDFGSFSSADNRHGSFSDFLSQSNSDPIDQSSNLNQAGGEVDLYQNSALGDGYANSNFDVSQRVQNEATPQQYDAQAWEDLYPGWTYNHQKGVWEEKAGYYNAGDKTQISSAQNAVARGHEANQVDASAGMVRGTDNVYWDQQYPGWYFDYQANQYREIPGYFQSGVPGHQYEDPAPSYDLNMQAEVAVSQGIFNGNGQQFGSGSNVERTNHTGASVLQDGFSQGLPLHSNGFGEPSTLAHSQPERWVGAVPNEVVTPTTGFDYHDPRMSKPKVSNVSKSYFSNPQFPSYSQNQYQFGQPVHYTVSPPRTHQEALRSTAGRPPHAVTAFGFGGSLVIMKPKDPLMSEFSAVEQAWSPGPFQVFQMSKLTGDRCFGPGHFTGPLVGGASMKEVVRWVDERTANCFEEPGCTNPASLRHLWGLLKISCQHYGNLRSSLNSAGMGKQDDDGPEAALAKLLESSKNEASWTFGSHCLQSMPSESQMQATAFEVKRLLIAGKQKEALHYAQEGQLWGPALLIARQLGEKYYSDTIAEMARRQFQPGFPLRTLSLLYAGQHAQVFVGNASSNLAACNVSQVEQVSTVDAATQDAVEGMLEEWQENLAIMAANRTNGDERVIMHLGDCLWRMRSEVAGAHICYLVANADFEPFSGTARLCLIGADHYKYPRTYAIPEAIQRTEVYEYARVSGNSQFILLPFQPYKLIYASMLAEAGRTSDALRYCQAVLKTLKTAGHGADICKEAATSLEERLRIHAQAGPTSIVHRLFSNMGFHKMIGGTPSSISRENADTSSRPATATSRSSNASPLVPSASMEPLSGMGRSSMPVRSISEPDFSRPAQLDSSGRGSSNTPNKNTLSLFVQKAMGFIRPSSKEAKLGGKNTFRYDEKLKRWVEEGAEAPAEEPAFAPPPTNLKLVPRSEDNDFHNAPAAASTPERQQTVSGIPPMPPSGNQYSVRARQNVRSRYVDTFNKNATSTPPRPSDSPLLPPARPSLRPPAKFFVPAAQEASVPEMGSTQHDGTGSTPDSNHQLSNSMLGASMRTLSPFVPDAVAELHDTDAASGNGIRPVALGGKVTGLQDVKGNGAYIPNGSHVRGASWDGYSDSSSLASTTQVEVANSPEMFYSNHYPTAASVVSLPPPPALEVAEPLMTITDSSVKEASAPLVHTSSVQEKEFQAGSGAFGDDMQEVEL